MNSALAIATPSSSPDVTVADALENSTAPTDYYYHVVAVIEFRLRELLDDRLSAPDPESPISLKELDGALRSIKSAVDARRKIAQLEKQTAPTQPKPIQPKTIQPKTARPPASNPEPIQSIAPHHPAAPAPAPTEPTAPAQSPESSNTTCAEQLPESPTSVPSELHSSNFTLQNSSSPPASRFQISEAARIRFLKERRHQLQNKSRNRPSAKPQIRVTSSKPEKSF